MRSIAHEQPDYIIGKALAEFARAHAGPGVGEPAVVDGLMQLRADCGSGQAAALLEQRKLKSIDQAQCVQHELERAL